MKKHLLIVDDEQLILDMLKRNFESVGYEVYTATTGQQCLELVVQHDILVVFLDLKLPDMNGLELCKKIKSHNPITCIFAVTGYSSLFELSNCRDAGFDDYFTKPVKVGNLFKATMNAFEKIELWTKRPS